MRQEDLIRTVKNAIHDHGTKALGPGRHYAIEAPPRSRPGRPGPDPRADEPAGHPIRPGSAPPVRAAARRPQAPRTGSRCSRRSRTAARAAMTTARPDRPAVRPARPRPVQLRHPGRHRGLGRPPGGIEQQLRLLHGHDGMLSAGIIANTSSAAPAESSGWSRTRPSRMPLRHRDRPRADHHRPPRHPDPQPGRPARPRPRRGRNPAHPAPPAAQPRKPAKPRNTVFFDDHGTPISESAS